MAVVLGTRLEVGDCNLKDEVKNNENEKKIEQSQKKRHISQNTQNFYFSYWSLRHRVK